MMESFKMRTFKNKGMIFSLCILSFWWLAPALYAASKRPIPRFVSLRSNTIKLRVGPGREYPVKWILKRKGLPVKITAEYDTWRQITCHDGTTGWVHQSLLTGRRHLMATGLNTLLLSSADRDAHGIAKIPAQKLMSFRLKDCQSKRCYVYISDRKGWVDKSQVWGLLDTE